MSLFGTSGRRGTVGDDVTPDFAVSPGRALPSLAASSVVIGRDPRTTGEFLADAVAAGARECGTDVVDIGLAAAVDVGDGTGRLTVDAPELLGATVTPVSSRPDGRSPNRSSEPTAESRTDLFIRITAEGKNKDAANSRSAQATELVWQATES